MVKFWQPQLPFFFTVKTCFSFYVYGIFMLVIWQNTVYFYGKMLHLYGKIWNQIRQINTARNWSTYYREILATTATGMLLWKQHVFCFCLFLQCCHLKSMCLITYLLVLAQDPLFDSPEHRPKQQSCNGDWSYEVTHFPGCPVGVTYPVARNCQCTSCDPGNTYCGRFPGDVSSCLSP